MNITLSEAVATAKAQGVTIGELEAIGFEIDLSGSSNVASKETTPEAPETKPELVEASAVLFEAGVKRAKTGNGRPKRTLGTKEGTYPYNVTVTIDPAYKS